MIYYCAGHVNVAPRHLTAESETLLSATLIHEVRFIVMFYFKNKIHLLYFHLFKTLKYVELSQVMHVLGFDPHAFTHFRDERRRRRIQVNKFTKLSC